MSFHESLKAFHFLSNLGQPTVDVHLKHPQEAAVFQLTFGINDGCLVTALTDDTLNLWNLRQKVPEIVHTIKFQRERITCIYLPLRSKFLYVGTERGNVHVVNLSTFDLSGYIINWNKAIEV
ncbi:unnamed protein product [Cyprideis torosa]|uniref:Uncharacterized protein n=1 Tax=Cyprideis torosa TaxID=163714 RepID=A0A7R8WAG2_9CRUS|nr:unnamed protein product [Cyprideis torosa]CAG0885292.1 unnamed protein product [Cyprideis torosa]